MEDVILLKKALQMKGIRGIALDIDDTLSNTLERWLREMFVLFGNPEGLSVNEFLQKYHHTDHVPYWQGAKVHEWILNAIEVEDFYEESLLIEERILEEIKKLQEYLPVMLYLTTRPASMVDATKRWLKKFEFPEMPILARPKHVSFAEGNIWKAKTLEALYPEIIGIVDDNVKVTLGLSEGYKGVVFQYKATEPVRNDIRVIPTPTWKVVVEQAALFTNVV